MAFLLPILFIVVILAVFASTFREGLWGNAVMLVNIVTAGLLATNFFEPMAAWLAEKWEGGEYFWDILCLWGLFAVILMTLRLITDSVSKVRVKFFKPVDAVGGPVLALINGWVVLCFVAMSLHTAPLSRNFMGGAFRAEDPIFFGMSPDRQWLGFMQMTSAGSLGRIAPAEYPELYYFDPQAVFMPKYASRREKYSQTDTISGKQ